jgi:hypothetical protein
VEYEFGNKVLRHYKTTNGEPDEKTSYWFVDLKGKNDSEE